MSLSRPSTYHATRLVLHSTWIHTTLIQYDNENPQNCSSTLNKFSRGFAFAIAFLSSAPPPPLPFNVTFFRPCLIPHLIRLQSDLSGQLQTTSLLDVRKRQRKAKLYSLSMECKLSSLIWIWSSPELVIDAACLRCCPPEYIKNAATKTARVISPFHDDHERTGNNNQSDNKIFIFPFSSFSIGSSEILRRVTYRLPNRMTDWQFRQSYFSRMRVMRHKYYSHGTECGTELRSIVQIYSPVLDSHSI